MQPAIAQVFARQAESCVRLGSPFQGRLCALFAQRLRPDSEFARRIDGWDQARAHPDALPLRAVGGLHALVRRGVALAAHYPPHVSDDDALWSAVLATISEHDVFLTRFLDSPPQTNEVARSSTLLGVALRLQALYALPMAWWELGASAGLNLGFPDYRYQLEVGSWGTPGAAVEIRSRWEGAHPELGPLTLRERAGCDLAPLDPRADSERLLSYVWPDQTERLARTQAALAAASWPVERAPASQWVAAKLRESERGVLRVVAHTIVWQYLPKPERESVRASIEHAGALATPETPLAWASVEGDGDPHGAAVRLRRWPGAHDEMLGRADFHGRWTRWV
jgi:hypothetical protein